MRVRVRLFAALRERAGTDAVELELADGARVADALAGLGELSGPTPVVMAVNREYAHPAVELHEGDELALIPPVSGGAPEAPRLHARVTDQPLSLDALAAAVSDPRAGAVVLFQGVTRSVAQLGYEAYAEMAEASMAEVAGAAVARYGLCRAAAEHRTGVVPLSEPSVIVAASAPHREAAFLGARYLIDTIKAQAPIWKKEEGEWVTGVQPELPAT